MFEISIDPSEISETKYMGFFLCPKTETPSNCPGKN